MPALESGIQIYILGCTKIHFLDVFQYTLYIDSHLCVHSSVHAYILCFYSIVYIFQSPGIFFYVNAIDLESFLKYKFYSVDYFSFILMSPCGPG